MAEKLMTRGQWYLLYVSSGREERAERNLLQRIKYLDIADKIFEVVIPKTKEIEIRSGKRRTVDKKAFPGYIMVRMDLDDTRDKNYGAWYNDSNKLSLKKIKPV